MKRSIKSSLAALVVFLSLAAPVLAGPFEDGKAAYERGDYVTALRLWRPLAEQGNALAQYYLGEMYEFGKGVSQNDAKAVTWFRKAAYSDQDLSPAQYNLGVAYHEGKGVLQDYAKAVAWFRFAAEKDYVPAQYSLGLMYARGEGVPQDFVMAVELYRKVAEQGFSTAQYSLGAMYAKGMGVRQDYLEAHKWFNLAASRVTASSAKLREISVNARDAVAKHMTPAQIAEAQRLAREWKPKK